MHKLKYSKAQVKELANAMRDAAKRCRKNDNRGSKVKIWEVIIHPSGWPQTVLGFHKEYARTLFQEPSTGLERRVVLLVDTGRIGIYTIGPHGKDNEFAPFDAKGMCRYFERITESARRTLAGVENDSRDIRQFCIDTLNTLR